MDKGKDSSNINNTSNNKQLQLIIFNYLKLCPAYFYHSQTRGDGEGGFQL